MRHGIFDKTDGARYQGIVGRTGKVEFERARRRLKQLAKWKTRVSDGDVFEFLSRGEANTVAYLKQKEGSAV